MSQYDRYDESGRLEVVTLPIRPGSRPTSRTGRPLDTRVAIRHPSPARFSHPPKRIIVACDGTWLDSDNGMLNGELQIESNVTRLARAILPEGDRGVQQIVFYHKGIGSSGGPVDRVIMGAVGEGLNQNVREAYSFISNNYAPGDEIFLVGFSRGAFTARTVAGVMNTVGILTKRGLTYLPEIYKDVLHRRDPRYRAKLPDVPFPNKPSANSPRYREELYRRGLTVLDVPIKAVGVWDTVGALGIPRVGILQHLGVQGREAPEMAFYDTKLPNIVENAFQALALDEKRTSFGPAVWEKTEDNHTRLRQVWFPGVHSNIGGGYDDEELSTITFAWMIAQLSPFLDFDRDTIARQNAENDEYYRSHHRRPRPWSFGKIINSMSGIYSLGGGTLRTPGRYTAADPESGARGKRPLRQTHEYIHPSVRTRFALRGPGTEDNGEYDPESLMDAWSLVVEYPDGPDGPPEIYWRARFRDDGGPRELPESPLWEAERELLAMDPRMEDEVLRPPPTRPTKHGR
ncbi:hypothetical protein BT63DRAFT_377602 [Microthyrium microscopicum]|uniref:T6SS Phospholipase effector Tle1-like catalytic domain-containing protein n=1 Tax=Microthyrium microscopicum TaxID=703497 RepID=A0A6A6U1S4_9PEZI|nr:hypothetical protein BT63DRAFT_377602 [Microthyrium microscopicum]